MPTLTPPVSESLKLKYDILLSNVAFKSHLRRYSWVLPYWRERAMVSQQGEACAAMQGKEGAGVVISQDAGETWAAHGRGLHSSTFQLNLSAFCGIGSASGGCLWGVRGY